MLHRPAALEESGWGVAAAGASTATEGPVASLGAGAVGACGAPGTDHVEDFFFVTGPVTLGGAACFEAPLAVATSTSSRESSAKRAFESVGASETLFFFEFWGSELHPPAATSAAAHAKHTTENERKSSIDVDHNSLADPSLNS